MKTLFIATKHNNFCGGEVCTLRNRSILQDILGSNSVTEVRIARNNSLKEKHRLLWFGQGFFNDLRMCSISGIDSKQFDNIKHIICTERIELVFLDSSLLGLLAKKIKQQYPTVKIITFFHNIEYLYYKRELDISQNVILRYLLPIIRKNEQTACLYSDAVITLNERDSQQLHSLYGRKADYSIPITLEDRLPSSPIDRDETDKRPPNMLFVGSYFSMNIEGIRHFVQHILPHTQAKLTIVGTGMKQLEERIRKNERIELFDYVEDLSKLYEEADFVVIPIYSGSGMKVKTAEALMYGKYIIGTPEAFTGYSISPETGKLCTNDQKFIEAINRCSQRGFNPASRELFLKKYSNLHAKEVFKEMIAHLNEPT